MDSPPTAAEARATAIAKLKRAASLPRMKDGRRPPMHVEGYSEGERSQGDDRNDSEERDAGSASSNGMDGGSGEALSGSLGETSTPSQAGTVGEKAETGETPNDDGDGEDREGETSAAVVVEDTVKTPRKRRSRSRTRSRGSKDLKGKALAKQSPQVGSGANESSADEYYASGSGPGEDPPPSPPLLSPIPSHIPGLPMSRLLRSPVHAVPPLFYPGTTPSTPLPSLDDIQKGVGAGLFRSNSAGAARAMAMSKLTGEPIDLAFISSQSPTPAGKLTRNNTVAGGERIAARQMMLHRLGNRINNQTDGEQTSGGEEAPPPPSTSTKKRRRRSHRRSSSRASTVVDDREDRELPATTPTTPIVPPSPLPPFLRNTPEPPRPPSANSRAQNGDTSRAPSRLGPNGNVPFNYETPLGHRGVVIEDEDDLPERAVPPRPPNLPTTPARNYRAPTGPRLPHTSDAPSNASTDSTPAGVVVVPMFLSHNPSFRGADIFPASPFQTPLKEQEPPLPDEEDLRYQEPRSRSRLALGSTNAFERDSEISWVAEPGE